MKKLPWLKFYPSDWRSDPALRMCSLSARGLWIEMLSLMHEADPYGHLLVRKSVPTDMQLAAITGAPSDLVTQCVGELEAAGVFSRTKKGVIYSRRMTADQKKRSVSSKNGKNGGNPSLGKQRENSASVNPQDKGGLKEPLKLKRLEARDQSIPPPPSGAPPQPPPAGESLAGKTAAQLAEMVSDVPKPSRKRATRMTEDWVLPEKWRDWAIEQDFDPATVRSQADRFRDYWLAVSGRSAAKLDWFATWRNWMRRTGDFSGGNVRRDPASATLAERFGTL